ncbi:MAG: Fic family protein, partial [Phycisphaerales bacterium JB040]
MSKQPTKWTPVSELPETLTDLVDPGVGALVGAWQDQLEELRDKDVYKSFVAKLRREWAIETGVLERLYELEDAATKVLIEHGLDESLLVSSDTDKPVDQVLALIRDQEAAISGMYQFVAEGRSLSPGYIKQLHGVLTEHQEFTEAVANDGSLRQTPLVRGQWRTTDAQVTDSNDDTWFYCEPALLEAQMLDLVSIYESHVDRGVPTEVNAAWLHHRFTLIHPFQDGNGRVARCLATLVMLKAGWLPLVVTRMDKPRYITALRAADDGDLRPLVSHFNDLQKRAILQALSLGQSVISERLTIRSMIEAANKRLGARAKTLAEEQKKAHIVAEALRVRTGDRLKAIAEETTGMLKEHSSDYAAFVDEAENGSGRDHYYRSQVVECAK